jgi:hypothetical protein
VIISSYQVGYTEDGFGITIRGVARIQDGTSNTVLIAERTGSTARCSADPGTGRDGITELNVHLREARTGEIVQIDITALDGPISTSGNHRVVVRFSDQVFETTLQARFPGPRSTERPGR